MLLEERGEHRRLDQINGWNEFFAHLDGWYSEIHSLKIDTKVKMSATKFTLVNRLRRRMRRSDEESSLIS